jgi:hypothetical protein
MKSPFFWLFLKIYFIERNSKELEELKENHQDKLAHGQTVAQLQIEYDSLMKELLLQQETYTV